jgi:hypothetical protein
MHDYICGSFWYDSLLHIIRCNGTYNLLCGACDNDNELAILLNLIRIQGKEESTISTKTSYLKLASQIAVAMV